MSGSKLKRKNATKWMCNNMEGLTFGGGVTLGQQEYMQQQYLLHVPKQGRHPALWHPDEWLYHIYKGDQDSENGQSQEDQGKQNGTSPASSKFYKL